MQKLKHRFKYERFYSDCILILKMFFVVSLVLNKSILLAACCRRVDAVVPGVLPPAKVKPDYGELQHGYQLEVMAIQQHAPIYDRAQAACAAVVQAALEDSIVTRSDVKKQEHLIDPSDMKIIISGLPQIT